MTKTKKKINDAPDSGASSLPAGEVTVKFRRQAFRYQGVIYKSDELERLAAGGDEHALLVIAQLVQRRSGIIEILKEKEGKNE